MSDKKLLEEATVKKFMKLANIAPPLRESFVDALDEKRRKKGKGTDEGRDDKPSRRKERELKSGKKRYAGKQEEAYDPMEGLFEEDYLDEQEEDVDVDVDLEEPEEEEIDVDIDIEEPEEEEAEEGLEVDISEEDARALLRVAEALAAALGVEREEEEPEEEEIEIEEPEEEEEIEVEEEPEGEEVEVEEEEEEIMQEALVKKIAARVAKRLLKK